MHALSFCYFGFKHEMTISFYTVWSDIDKNSPLIKCCVLEEIYLLSNVHLHYNFFSWEATNAAHYERSEKLHPPRSRMIDTG